MRVRNLWVSFFLLLTSFQVQGQEAPTMVLYPVATNTAQREVAWSTRPGIRYLLQETTNLVDSAWSTVQGFPTEAQALAQQHVIELDAPNHFFRVQALDEQPPEMLQRHPDHNDFGVGRFSPIRLTLADGSGIDANSISLTLGTNGTFSVSSPEVSWSNNLLTLDLGGDAALGGYGETQTVQLAVADGLGNATNLQWQFELEEKIVAATNLFVFGSPTAQRAGQRLSGVSATVAARFNGPVRMAASAYPWTIDSVTSNTVVLAYTGTNAPSFEVGQKLANLAPAHKSEIFYRRVTSIADDAATKRLTLGTTDVLIGEIMESGSFSLGDDTALFLEFNTNGTLVSAKNTDKTISLPIIGRDFSGTTLWSAGALDLSLAEGCFTLTPTLQISLETEKKVVERFEATLSGDLNISCVPQLTVTGTYNDSIEKELWNKSHWFWTAAGYVPVGIELDTSITAKAEIGLDSSATLSLGFRQAGHMSVSGTYVRGMVPASTMKREPLSLDPPEHVPFTYTLNGSGNAMVSLVPQIDCRLYGAAGIYLNTNPRLEVAGSATMMNMQVTEAEFRIGAYADINVGLSLIGDLGADLPSLSFNYFTEEWNKHVEAETLPLTTVGELPISKTASYGDYVIFSVQADGGTGSYIYQWFQNGNILLGETSDTLRLIRVGNGHEGEFFAKITSGSETIVSDVANLNIVETGGTGNTAGMVRIPGGTNSGTDPDFGAYSLTVSSFYMDRTEVTKAQWDRVYNWAINHGYSFSNRGSGKGSNHPVHTVNWYDCVKWCNARSEMEGRTPCYNLSNWSCNFGANGYRLPTSEEWEYAARGGRRSSRFPWGNTISHGRANYYGASSWFSYDQSDDYHPRYDSGGNPYTSPVGSFSSNGYGLYDMSGNVWEWCTTASGSSRYVRGGSWYNGAYYALCGFEGWNSPDGEDDGIGFRAVCR